MDARHKIDAFIEYRNSRKNKYRTEAFAQPRALIAGDVLSSGITVRDEPFDDLTKGVSLLFSDYAERFVPARIPLKLNEDGVLPQALKPGDVLQTGCTVLESPHILDGSRRSSNQRDVVLSLTGGHKVQEVATPDDLELAVYGTIEDLDGADAPFAEFVIEKLSYLRKRTLHSLANRALFETVLLRSGL